MPNTTHEPLNTPIIEQGTGELPSSLTFFLTRDQRRAVLRSLSKLSKDRTRALLIAAGVELAGEGVRS
ncbi:MAG: hypothetical protein R3B67_07250 [Phycisphaerales bacterium]